MNREQDMLFELAKHLVDNRNPFPVQPITEVDWDRFYSILLQQKVFPLLYPAIREHIPRHLGEIYEEKYSQHVAKVDRLLAEIENLSAFAHKRQLPYILHKGVVLSQIIYGNLYARNSGDIDFLIRDSDVSIFDSFLRGHGYIQAVGLENVHLIQEDQYHILPYPILKQHIAHEYFNYRKTQSSGSYITVELQRYLHQTIKEEYIAEFIQSSEMVAVGRTFVKTFELTYTFLALCEDLYDDTEWFAGPRLKGFIDMAMFLNRYGDSLDWRQISALARRYSMSGMLRKMLGYVHALFAQTSIGSILSKLGETETAAEEETWSLEWDCGIRERLFIEQPELRKKLFGMLKKRCYSGQNLKLQVPLTVGTKRLETQEEFQGSLVDYKYAFNIRYAITRDDRNLIFHFIYNEELYEKLNTLFIRISLIDHRLENERLNSCVIELQRSGDKIIGLNEHGHAFYICRPLALRDLRGTTLEVPFRSMDTERERIPSLLGFSISLVEKVYMNVEHIISLDVNDRQFWNSPNIMFIGGYSV